jgi:hypothetical protein
LIDEFSKNICVKARNDYLNKTITDGLNTLQNVIYKQNESDTSMLDINSFSGLYSPHDQVIITSIFNMQSQLQLQKKRIPHPIGKFDFYNFKSK